MTQSWSPKFGLASWLAIGGAIITSLGNCANAQITPDNTLGNENSNVTSTGSVDQIEGGATRGANLFHSFEEFSVDQGQAAYFTNPAGIENILSRVTGSNPSEILGTLGVSGGNANLFLINPNGIVFGPNARLDVGGSFVGTTANGIGLANGDMFSANPGDALPNQLLNVNPNAFFFNQVAAQPIINRSTAGGAGLEVPQGKSLLLVGGNVSLEGGRLQAPGGRVELGGLARSGNIGLSVAGDELRSSFPDQVQRADISLTNRARVNVAAGGGGSIAVNAQDLNLVEGSKLEAGITPTSKLGSVDSKAGDIEINATEAITLADQSIITNSVQPKAIGKGGDIHITAGSFSATNGSELFASTEGQGDAGNVTIEARDTVEFAGLAPNQFSSGAYSQVLSEGRGEGGSISVEARSLSVTNGAVLATSTRGQENAGSVTIDVRDTVEFKGGDEKGRDFPYSGAYSRVKAGGEGQAGNINIKTGSLSVTNGAVLATSTRGQGNAGSVTIDVRDTVEFKGGDEKGRAFLYSGAYSQVEQRGVGQAGDLTITTEQLIVRDRAKVTVSSTGSGNAGELRVEASSIRLENQGKIISETKAGQGGNIALQLQDLLLLREQSQISTTAGTAEAGGDGGNIDIDSDFIVAVPGESSDITANAFAGNGGNIDIDAFSVFGIEPRELENPASNDINDITASSELGLEGTIEIDTPDVDPSRGLVELPTVPVETEVAQACSPGSSQQQSEFVVTGRGGLPPTPEEALSSDAIQVDWVSLKPEAAEEQESKEAEENSPTSGSSNPSVPNQIVEAQGWVTAPNGEVVLTASATPGQHPSSWLTPANCHDN